MRKFLGILLFISFFSAATELDYYLPNDVSFNPEIPTPESILGYQVGEWHVRHDQLISYMRALEAASDRISIEEIGRSHEQRPLIMLRISAAENINNVETIRKYHISGVINGHVDSQPAVLWMGYSVHGNESSGANAALLIAYYLAAAEGEKINNLLNNSIIIMEPVINPDGLDRFAQWANMHKGVNLVADANHREHVEDWPSGRTNHYWFDLNRDWLLLTHPESQARIKYFHRWKPNLVTDFHEMGTNSTYFFQPGIPSRKNPYTPDKNVQLTHALAKFHAKALDDVGSLYYTEESFDDFYAGKGSTYPDLQGSVGILFEQASSRGHLQESINGMVSFPFTIKNQVLTSLSSLYGAVHHKKELLNYQNKFFASAESEANKDEFAGFVITEDKDNQRLQALLDLLAQHQISSYKLSEDLKTSQRTYSRLSSFFVPLKQPQYRLIKSIFSTQKSFADNTFYDVSNWNLALSFNVQFEAIKQGVWRSIKYQKLAWEKPESQSTNQLTESYAYGFKWQQYNAPKLLMRLLQLGFNTRFSNKPFVATSDNKPQSFPAGSIVIPTGLSQPDGAIQLLEQHANELGITVFPISTGLSEQGIDLGSRKIMPVNNPKILLIGGKGISQYEAGELWHYLDIRLGLPVTIVEQQRLTSISFGKYTHIFMVQGKYNLDEKTKANLTAWVKSGGTLIGQKSASKWLAENDLLDVEFLSTKDYNAGFDSDDLSYKDKELLAGKKRIAGAVFEYQLDNSHPLTFGFFDRKTLPAFRNSNNVMLMPEAPFTAVATYSDAPLIAGYASPENLEFIKNSAAIVAHNKGKGRVIGFADNPNFRGVWYGTSHLIANSIFFSNAIETNSD